MDYFLLIIEARNLRITKLYLKYPKKNQRSIENGQKARDGKWVDDKQEGTWTAWFDNGEMFGQGEFAQGEAQGRWVFYWPSGEKESEGDYVDGQKQEDWTYWDEPLSPKG